MRSDLSADWYSLREIVEAVGAPAELTVQVGVEDAWLPLPYVNVGRVGRVL